MAESARPARLTAPQPLSDVARGILEAADTPRTDMLPTPINELTNRLQGGALPGEQIVLGGRPSTAKTALLFPGQASQYVGMGEELTAVSPAAAEVLHTDPEFTIANWLKSLRIANEEYAERLANGLRKAGFRD